MRPPAEVHELEQAADPLAHRGPGRGIAQRIHVELDRGLRGVSAASTRRPQLVFEHRAPLPLATGLSPPRRDGEDVQVQNDRSRKMSSKVTRRKNEA